MTTRILRHYYLLATLTYCGGGMIAATYVSFLLAHGLNLFEVNLVNIAFFITLTLGEIPTGTFADVFGRKPSFITSCFLYTASMWLYATAHTFTGFVIAEVVGGFGLTFASGAFDAWLVDALAHHGHTGRLEPIFATASQLRRGFGIGAAIGGAALADLWLPLPWIVGGCIFLTAGIIALRVMKEDYFVRQRFSFRAGLTRCSDTIRASIHYGLTERNIRFIMVLVATLNFAVMAPNMQWQPFFGRHFEHQQALGFIWAAMALSLMAGVWGGPRLLRVLGSERSTLVVCHLVTGTGIIVTALVPWLPAALLIFFLHELGRGAFEPVKNAYLHRNIPSRERATIVSFESLAHHAGGGLGLMISGVLALVGSISLAWSVAGLALVGVTLMVWKNGHSQ